MASPGCPHPSRSSVVRGLSSIWLLESCRARAVLSHLLVPPFAFILQPGHFAPALQYRPGYISPLLSRVGGLANSCSAGTAWGDEPCRSAGARAARGRRWSCLSAPGLFPQVFFIFSDIQQAGANRSRSGHIFNR